MTIIQIVIELEPPAGEGAIIGVMGRPLELPERVWPWTPALSGVLGMTIGPLVVGGCWEVEMTVEVLVDSIEVEDAWLVGGASVLVVGLRVVVVRRVVVVAGSVVVVVVVVGGEVVVVVAVVVVVTVGHGTGLPRSSRQVSSWADAVLATTIEEVLSANSRPARTQRFT